jgi:hypothetical protein
LYVCGDGVDTAQEKNPEGRRPKQFKSSEGLLLVFKRTSPREKAEPPKKEPDKNPVAQDQAKQIIDLMIRLGVQAYQKKDSKQRKPMLRIPLPEGTMMTVALSANGKLLAVATTVGLAGPALEAPLVERGGTMEIWDRRLLLAEPFKLQLIP